MARIAAVRPLTAFLDLIAKSEGTSLSRWTHDDGYDIIVTGVNGVNTFSDYSTHPFARGRAPILVREPKPAITSNTLTASRGHDSIVEPAVPALHSTASGRYQLILPTWHSMETLLHLSTFNPTNQDLAALKLLEECHAEALIMAGKIASAIEAACETWASFPGNGYGQGGRTLDWLLRTYQALLTDPL